MKNIASTMHISRPTVYRYIKMGDFNDLAKESAKDPTENAEKGKSPPEEDHSILAGYKELINSFLKSSTFFRQIETFKRQAKTTFRQIETIERQ